MATFALVHGAWHGGWAWDLLSPELRAHGHDVGARTTTTSDPSPRTDPVVPVSGGVSEKQRIPVVAPGALGWLAALGGA
jgi:hypothetical protein